MEIFTAYLTQQPSQHIKCVHILDSSIAYSSKGTRKYDLHRIREQTDHWLYYQLKSLHRSLVDKKVFKIVHEIPIIEIKPLCNSLSFPLLHMIFHDIYRSMRQQLDPQSLDLIYSKQIQMTPPWVEFALIHINKITKNMENQSHT